MVATTDYHHRRSSSYNAREDRNVNLGVINVPVRTKVVDGAAPHHRATTTTHQQQVQERGQRRAASAPRARGDSAGREYRDAPPPAATHHRQQHRHAERPEQDAPPHKGVQGQYELECDYDRNPTVLYELLESSAWEKARLRCRTHAEEVRTWIVRRDKNQLTRWRLLPLHAAIIFQAPSYIVSTLLERYPAAATRQDDQGMLPLHLAFRHKQDDEELLELLLLENPRAVNQPDRRGRVPLEHGREARYSGKLMRLYTEAAVTAVGGHHHYSDGSKHDHHTHLTATTAPSSPMGTTATVSLTHMHRLEAELEAKLAKAQADHEQEIGQLKSRHQSQMSSLKEDLSLAVAGVEQEAQRHRRSLQEQHQKEIYQLREELEERVREHQAVQDELRKEIMQLQETADEAKHHEESIAEKYGKLVTVNVHMQQFLQDLLEEQCKLQELAERQQEYLEAARMIRTELAQTLLKQEDSDGVNERLKGTQMIEIGERVQRKINDFVKANSLESKVHSDLHQHHYKHVPDNHRKGPSRIEVERHDNKIYSTREGAAAVRSPPVFFASSNGSESNFHNRIPHVSNRTDSFYDEKDVEMLADEISAITDNSGY